MEIEMLPRSGFEEDALATYTADNDPCTLVGQFRRFGEDGPAYQVLRLIDKDKAWICVVYSEEELAYSIAEIVLDPIAETVP